MSLTLNRPYENSEASDVPLVDSLIDFRFHPSSIAKLMTKKPPYYSLKQLNVLYNDYVYNQYNTFMSDDMKRGIDMEDESIRVVNELTQSSHKKNEVTIDYKWVQGTCDILTDEEIIDIKTKKSLESLNSSSLKENEGKYFWQLASYVYIYNLENGYPNYKKASICDVYPEAHAMRKYTYQITDKHIYHLESILTKCIEIMKGQLKRDLASL